MKWESEVVSIESLNSVFLLNSINSPKFDPDSRLNESFFPYSLNLIYLTLPIKNTYLREEYLLICMNIFFAGIIIYERHVNYFFNNV